MAGARVAIRHGELGVGLCIGAAGPSVKLAVILGVRRLRSVSAEWVLLRLWSETLGPSNFWGFRHFLASQGRVNPLLARPLLLFLLLGARPEGDGRASVW